MLAIIKTGGKQYLVSQGMKVKVEKLEGNPGGNITFENVLFSGDKNGIEVGLPQLINKRIEATIISQGRHEKVTGVKHKAKKRYKMKFGHKQHFTEVEIGKIE